MLYLVYLVFPFGFFLFVYLLDIPIEMLAAARFLFVFILDLELYNMVASYFLFLSG